jgi:Flp pilus assembly protein TadD
MSLMGLSGLTVRTRRAALPALAAAVLLSACAGPSGAPDSASLGPGERASGPQRTTSAPAADLAPLAAAHNANPSDAAAALAYARGLRVSGAKKEALAVLDAAAAKASDRRLTLERGLLALDLGDTAKAEKLLRQAREAKTPDWRLHSALGSALASRGQQKEAQAEFSKALALAPDQPSVLNNLALSYALDGKTDEAEQLLRRAQRGGANGPQVQQNLALVLGLRGKYDEARTVAAASLPPAEANGNVAYLQTLASGKQATSSADAKPGTASARAKASASLPQPSYQLGGPKE